VNVSFTSVLVIAAIAFIAPLLLGLLPRAPLPAVVLELVGGILVGPSVLGWERWTRPSGRSRCSVWPSWDGSGWIWAL